MTETKISAEKKKRDCKLIKEELKRYFMYRDKVTELKNTVKSIEKEYEEEMNNPHVGGSIAKMPEGAPEHDNIVMKWESKLADANANLRYYKMRVHELNNWLSILTRSQYAVVMKYVCEYQCIDRWHAAAELKCDDETVKSTTKDAMERIRKKIKKIF